MSVSLITPFFVCILLLSILHEVVNEKQKWSKNERRVQGEYKASTRRAQSEYKASTKRVQGEHKEHEKPQRVQ
jgi:hypothetical protein